MKKFFVVVGLLLVTLSTGCTRSLDVAYQCDTKRLPNAAALEKVTLGVGKFEDKRAWVEQENPESESYIALQDMWKFGLSYKEKDYVPVKDIVQDLLIQELSNAGFKAQPIDKIVSKANTPAPKVVGSDACCDYILGGELLAFEFVNEMGMWTVTSRRSATLNLILFDGRNSQPVMETVLTETDREGEGMGVLHSTNVEKLMDKVFRKVAQQVIQKTSEKIAVAQQEAK